MSTTSVARDATDPGTPHERFRDELQGALDPARAALWLLDQLKYGELGFLTIKNPALPPCWVSAAACEGMDPTDLADWLEDLALKGLATALGELHAAVERPESVFETFETWWQATQDDRAQGLSTRLARAAKGA